jgi:hypothetical protein
MAGVGICVSVVCVLAMCRFIMVVVIVEDDVVSLCT